jgi:hypothetical protein
MEEMPKWYDVFDESNIYFYTNIKKEDYFRMLKDIEIMIKQSPLTDTPNMDTFHFLMESYWGIEKILLTIGIEFFRYGKFLNITFPPMDSEFNFTPNCIEINGKRLFIRLIEISKKYNDLYVSVTTILFTAEYNIKSILRNTKIMALADIPQNLAPDEVAFLERMRSEMKSFLV